MTTNTHQLPSPLDFEEILDLVRQLPPSAQIKLSQEINKNLEHQPIQYRTQTFKDLLQQVEPVPSNFDPQQAKADYLAEKHSL
jgi:hypothetical protein